MKKFSIIIPVYNVELYIRRCLSSIFNQDLSENLYEIIVINDGTQDNSMQIVNEFANHHTNLRILNRVNGGVSMARNAGLQIAEGEYVTFIDADDWIVEGSLKNVYAILNEKIDVPLDVLLLISQGTNGTIYYAWKDKCITNHIYSGVEIFSNGFRRGSVWGGWYNRNFLLRNKITFPEGVRNGEDSIFINLVFIYAVRLCFQDIPFYVVCERIGSASRTFNEEHLKLMINGLDFIKKLIDTRFDELSPIQRNMLSEMLYAQMFTLTYSAIAVGNIPLKKIKKAIPLCKYLPIQFEKPNSKGWKLILLNKSYTLYYWLFKLKVRLT